MNCMNCGEELGLSDSFCGNCGNSRALTPPRPLDGKTPEPRVTVSQTVVRQEDIVVGPSQFDTDAVYLQKTLRHEPMELALDDSVSLRTLGIMLVRSWLAGAIVFIVLGIFGGIEAAHGGGSTLLFVAVIGSIVVFWVVLLASKVTEPIGEWRALLADRAGYSESYYRMITVVLERRELPITPRLRSIKLTTRGGPVKHTIVLSENEYQAYVTVFPYGTSLYVGWQMWRRRSGAQLIRRALIDRVTAANLVTAMLRTDRARAVREAVHLACREALYATPDEGLWAQAQQLRLPTVEHESALLTQQPASPALPQPSVTIPDSPAAPAPAASAMPAPRPPASMENPHE
jgi:hypothetical protein